MDTLIHKYKVTHKNINDITHKCTYIHTKKYFSKFIITDNIIQTDTHRQPNTLTKIYRNINAFTHSHSHKQRDR